MVSIITAHAIERYVQRVEAVTEDEVIARLDTPHIRRLIAFGAAKIKLATGHRLVIADGRIVTVTPKPLKKRCQVGKPKGLSNDKSSKS